MEVDSGDGRPFDSREVLSEHLLHLLLLVGHGLLASSPQVALLHDEGGEQGQLGLVEPLAQQRVDVVLLLAVDLLVDHHLDRLALLPRRLLAASPVTVVLPLHGQQQLLDTTARPVPDVEVTSSLLGDDLQDGLEVASSEVLLGGHLCLALLPQPLLLAQPRLEVVLHGVFVGLVEGDVLIRHSAVIGGLLFPLNRHGLLLLGVVDPLRGDFGLDEAHQLLLPVVLHIEGLLLQPLWEFDLGDGVGDALQDSGDAHHLLDLRRQPLEIVPPVQYLPDVHLHCAVQQGVVLRPLVDELLLHLHVRVEDLRGNGALGHRPVLRIAGDHEVAAQTALALHHLRAQELRQPSGRAEGHALGGSVVVEVAAEHSRLLEVVQYLAGVHGLAVPLDDGEVFLGHGCAVPVALLQSRPHEVLGEDLLLEDLGDPQLPPAFHLEPLELLDLVVEVEHHVPLLQHLRVVLLDVQLRGLLLLLGRRDHHRLVGTVDLEEDGHLLATAVPPLLRVLQPLVLLVRVLVVDQVVQDVAGVGDLQGLARLEAHLDVFGEAVGQQHPDAVGVQLQGLADPPLDVVAAVADDVGSQVGHHCRHFHGVPPRTLPHHVAVETVQDDLVRQLHRLVQDHQPLRLLRTRSVLRLRQRLVSVLGGLGQVFVLVPAVPEGPDRVHIERILPHADDIRPCLSEINMRLLVYPLRVSLHLSLNGLLQLQRLPLELRTDLLPDLEVLALVEGEERAAPLPLQLPLALVLGLVEEAARAGLVVDDGDGLQAVGQDDVGVHGGHVDVVDQGEGLVLVRTLHVPQTLQLLDDLRLDLLLVDQVVVGLLRHLDPNGEPDDLLHPVDQVLEGRGLQREISGEVSAVDSSPQALHLTSSICLSVQQIALVVLVDVLQLLVGEDDAPIECLGHEQILAEGAAALPEHLIREHGDDSGECEDEAVDVLHIQEVSCHRIGNRVLRQSLSVILCQPDHLLHLHLNRIIVQFGLGHRLQSPRTLGQEGVAVHPVVAVEVRDVAAVVLATLFGHAHLCGELEEVEFHPAFDVGIVEPIAVVGSDDIGVVILDEAGEPQQQILLRELVEDSHVAGVLGLGLVVELLHLLAAVVEVDDQEGLPLVHQTDHHDLVLLGVGELQGVLGGLDVVGEDLEFGHSALASCRPYAEDDLVLDLHLEPLSRPEASVDAHPRVEGYVELPDARDEVRHVLEVLGLAAPVEGVVVVVLPLPSLVYQPLEWSLRVCQILHGAEVNLQVLFLPAREVVFLLEIDLLLHLHRFDLLQLGLEVGLHLLLHARLEPHVEVGAVGQHALDQLALLALEEAEHGHAFLIIMQLILKRPGLEVSEEAEDAPPPLVEGDPHLLLELLALVLHPLPHWRLLLDL